MIFELLAKAAMITGAVFLFGIGIVFAMLAAVTLRVMIDLIKAGPGAADRAYRNGDSIKAWWTGKHPNPTRRSIVGRKHKTLGVVMEEASSRDPDF